jgi:hypothetical protein
MPWLGGLGGVLVFWEREAFGFREEADGDDADEEDETHPAAGVAEALEFGLFLDIAVGVVERFRDEVSGQVDFNAALNAVDFFDGCRK